MGKYNCHAKFEEIYQTSSGAPAEWKIRCEISILSYCMFYNGWFALELINEKNCRF